MQETTETHARIENTGMESVEMTYKRVDHAEFEKRACE